MKVLRFSASLLALVAVAAIAQQLSDFSFYDPDWGSFKVSGVCDANPAKISCWKPDGSPNPDLTELANAYFLVNPQQTLNLRYKHRTLLVAVQSQLKQGVNSNQLETDPGSYMNGSVQIGYNGNGTDTTNLYWYYPGDDLTKVDVSAQLHAVGKTFDSPLKAGAVTMLDGAKLTITGVRDAKKGDESGNAMFDKAKRWVVSYTLEGDNAKNYPIGYVQVYDKEGRYVQSVDEKGKPVTLQGGWMANWVQPMLNHSGGWVFAIDPAQVSKITFSEQRTTTLKFKGIALQPK